MVPDTGSLPDAALAAAGPGWRLYTGQLPDRAEWRSWAHWVDLAWVLLWLLGLAGIVIFGRWEDIPFHLIWISFALLYSFRVRATKPTLWVLAAMTATTFAAVSLDVSRGAQPAAELTEVPMMAAMVWVMLWHGHRRLAASAEHLRVSEENERLLATQRRFLQDASHQLKTPITIALGHAELLARNLADGQDKRDINVIVGELNRLRKLSERLLLIAASANPDFLVPEPVGLDEFSAEVLWRWRPTADRKWQFGRLDEVTASADRERLGLAVDALLENAVQHTGPGDVIKLSVIRDDRAGLARILVADGGSGIAPAEAGLYLRPVRDRNDDRRAARHRARAVARPRRRPRPWRRGAGIQHRRLRQHLRDLLAGRSGQWPGRQQARADRRSVRHSGGAMSPPSGSVRGWQARLRGMHRTTKIAVAGIAVFILVIALVSLSTSAAGKPKAPPPLARTFSLAQVGQRGHSVSLASYRGHPVIINFFASWCPPCKRETPMLARFYVASKGRVDLIGVDANDSIAPALRFLRAAGVRYPVAFDPYPASTTTSYGVLGLPQTFFLNAQHRVVKHVIGQMSMAELNAGVALMNTSAPAAHATKDRG